MKSAKLKEEKKKPEKAMKKKAVPKNSKTGQASKSKPKKKLRVLILEDSAADAELLERQLNKDSIAFVSQRADTRSRFSRALKAFRPELILADYRLPQFNALQALELRNKMAPEIPFIIITGTISEETAVQCMKQGANDYLLKDRLARLPEAVKHALKTRQLQLEKRKSEESLRASERLHHIFIDSSADMVFLKDAKFRHLMANKALCRFYKKTEKEIIGRTDAQLMDKSAAARCRKTDQQALAENRVHVSEETINGLIFETHKFPVKLSDGRIGVGGYIRDISERKRTQELIEQSARKWTTTFDAIKDGIVLLATDQTVLQANRAFADLLDKPFEEIIDKKCYELVYPTHTPPPDCPFAKMLKSKKRESMELAIGERVFAVIVDPITNNAGAITGATHILNDITKHKHDETALRESEKKFRDLAELLPQTVFETDLQGKLTFVNHAAFESFGYHESDFKGGLRIWQMLVPGDRTRAAENMHRVIAGESTGGNEYTALRKDGSELPILLYSTLIQTSGQPTGIRGILVDINERKKSENALRQSEARFRAQYQGSPIAVLTWQKQGESFVLTEYNANAEKITHGRVKTFIGKKASDMYKDRPDILKAFHHCFESRDVTSLETISKHFVPDRQVLSTYAFIPPDLVMVHLEDITERKQIEADLKESENRYRKHFENSSEFFFTLDLKGNFVDVNKAAESLTRHTKSELLKMNFRDYTPKRDHGKLFRALAKVFKTGEPVRNFLVEAVMKDKSIKYFETNFSLLKDGEQIIGFQGSSKDITERRRAEELLHERDQLLQNLSAQIPGMIFTFLRRPDGRYSIPYSSNIIQDSFGVAPKDVCEDAAPLFAAILAEDRPRVTAAIEESARSLSTWQQEFRVQQPGQPVRWVWGKSEPFRLADGSILWYGFTAEITERKQAEEKLRATLQEKEVLLKEIHHRVKNNLQVISGLLTLQAQQIDDERLRNVLQDSQSRIWTMALIHQTLYQSGNLADIEIADYIRGLTSNLLSSHARVAMPPTVIFDLLPLRLAIDKAIPLALILNELVTNAMKHAFPDNRAGEIRISLQERRGVKFHAPTYELTIADNGVGLAAGFDPQCQKSLGLQLVAMLAKQLDGALTIESASGTIAAITFNCHGKS